MPISLLRGDWALLKIWLASLSSWLQMIVWGEFSPSTEDSLQFDAGTIRTIALHSISKRRHAGDPAKDHPKVALRAETSFQANVRQRLVRSREQHLRF